MGEGKSCESLMPRREQDSARAQTADQHFPL